MRSRTALGSVVLALGWPAIGCAAEPAAVAPPPTLAEAGLDPEVADLLRGLAGAAAESPADGELRGRLGLAYEANGIDGAARQAYEQAAVLAPEQARWWYHLARARAQLGELEGALDDVGRAIERDGGYPPAYWRRGLWQLELGELEGAELSLRAAIERDPKAPAPRVGLARVLLRRQQEEEALDLLRAELSRRPRDAYLHHLLATAYRQAGRPEAARSHALEAGRSREPRWRDPWRDEMARYQVGFSARHKRAIRLAGAGRRPQAIALFERLRKERPDDAALASNLGATYLDAGKTAEALEVLLEALEQRPQSFEIHLNLSTAYERQDELERAEEHIDRAIEASPFRGIAHHQKGRYLARRKHYEEALAAFGTARSYDARTPTSLIWSGWVRCELGRWSRAASDFSTALDQDPSVAEAHLGLALAKAELGEHTGARSAFAQASRLGPGDPRMPAIGRRILALGRSGGDS